MNNINIQQQKYRVTNIGLLPTDWDVDSLDKVIEPVSRAVSKPLNGYWRLGIRSHAKGTFHEYIEEPEKISMDTLYLVKENDLIVNITFAWEHAIALANKEDDGKLVSHRFPTYVFKSNADPLFYKYYVMQPKFKYELEIISPGGAGRNRVMSKKDFLKIEVCIPPLKEQQKIASILSTWDKAIDLKEKLIEQKKQQKKGLMQKLLTGEVRLPGFEEEWEEVKLGELGDFKTSSVDKKVNKNDIEILLVNYMDVYRNRVIDNTIDFMKVTATEKQIETFNVQYGDVLFTPSSETPDDIGHSAVVKVDSAKILYSYHLVRLRFKREMDVDFKAYVFNSSNLLREFSKRATGATRYTLSLSDFKESTIRIPKDITEQKAIGTVLLNSEREIRLLKKELEILKQQKKGLMQLLLTGKVRVQV